MSGSKTDICNIALDYLGEDEMADFAEPVSRLESRVVRRYPGAKALVLKKHRWTVARATLENIAALAETDSQYPTVIQLPGDCLLVWSVNGYDDGWERRNGPGAGKVAGNFTAPASLVYNRDLAEGELPVELQRAIGAQLAEDCMNGPNIDLTAEQRRRIEAAVITTIDIAVDVHGAEGGISENFESRFVEALHGRTVIDNHLRKFV